MWVFREEYQTRNAIAALKEKLAVRANVKRDGKWDAIPARELVPGDIIRLRIGNIIPADARLPEGDPVQVDQSALTGESLPVEHRSGDAVFSGSILKRGEIDAVVYGPAGIRTTVRQPHWSKQLIPAAICKSLSLRLLIIF